MEDVTRSTKRPLSVFYGAFVFGVVLQLGMLFAFEAPIPLWVAVFVGNACSVFYGASVMEPKNQ